MSIEVRAIGIALGGRPILDDVSFMVPTGTTLAVCGPSGAGKSTLLRIIAGLATPDSGRVLIDGDDVTGLASHRRSVGLVFQDDQLFPHLDVAANVGYGPKVLGWRRDRIIARVDELLAGVGLLDLRHQDVSTLSGGEAKRVALARSLAPSPRVLLLDEPLSGLDVEMRDRLAADLVTVLHDSRTTSILVSHDPAEVEAIAHATYRLPGRPTPT